MFWPGKDHVFKKIWPISDGDKALFLPPFAGIVTSRNFQNIESADACRVTRAIIARSDLLVKLGLFVCVRFGNVSNVF